jgi:hypothetical protein
MPIDPDEPPFWENNEVSFSYCKLNIDPRSLSLVYANRREQCRV